MTETQRVQCVTDVCPPFRQIRSTKDSDISIVNELNLVRLTRYASLHDVNFVTQRLLNCAGTRRDA